MIEQYLKTAKKKLSDNDWGKKDHYGNKKSLMGNKLIIYQPKNKKNDNYHMRYYVGDRKYKILSLSTTDENKATEKALEKWRILSNQLESGGAIFEKPIVENLDEYFKHLEQLVEIGKLNLKTLRTKRCSCKKLRLRLEIYNKLSEVPSNFLDDYVVWRRTKNWDREHHKNNPKPPSDMTINTELKDFKGFFNWCAKTKKFTKDIEYPFQKIDWKKSVEKNPSFSDDDWQSVVMYLRSWTKKNTTTKGKQRKNNFYRSVFAEFMKILANSGLRVHEALLLTWGDITFRRKFEIENRGKQNEKQRERIIAHIEVAPNTKTGRRLVICTAGIYLKRLQKLYKESEGKIPSKSDFIFRNIGTKTSKNAHIGNALSDTFLRRIWYEFRDDLAIDKGIEFDEPYTLHSCRAFYINKRLEFGVPPAVLAEMVGHSIRTMERHYKRIRLKQLEPELVQLRRKSLELSEFHTFDLD